MFFPEFHPFSKLFTGICSNNIVHANESRPRRSSLHTVRKAEADGILNMSSIGKGNTPSILGFPVHVRLPVDVFVLLFACGGQRFRLAKAIKGRGLGPDLPFRASILGFNPFEPYHLFVSPMEMDIWNHMDYKKACFEFAS